MIESPDEQTIPSTIDAYQPEKRFDESFSRV